jgi:hypothetical protein
VRIEKEFNHPPEFWIRRHDEYEDPATTQEARQ